MESWGGYNGSDRGGSGLIPIVSIHFKNSQRGREFLTGIFETSMMNSSHTLYTPTEDDLNHNASSNMVPEYIPISDVNI